MSTSVGNGFPNLINGTAGRDTISGLDGPDTLNGNGGADYLSGGDGADSMSGAEGADTLADDGLDGANDTLLGGEGNDGLRGGAGFDLLSGGEGDDSLLPGAAGWQPSTGPDSVDAGSGNDTVWLNRSTGLAAQTLTVLPPSEVTVFDAVSITGVEHFYVAAGTAGDTLAGGAGSDSLYGGFGNDSLVGGAGANYLFGGDGADTIRSTSRSDLIRGESGTDLFIGDYAAETLGFGYYGEPDLEQVSITGGSGSDTLWGGGSDATVVGGGDDDVIRISRAAGGVSRIEGGDGEDMLSLELHSLASPVNLVIQGPALTTVLGNTTITGVERFEIWGTSGTDTLVGGAGNDTFHDTSGKDIIQGGGGTDIVWFGSISYRYQAVALADGAFTVRSVLSGVTTGEPTMSGIELVGFGHEGIDSTEQEIFWSWELLGQAAPAATGMPRAAGIEARVNTTTAGDQALTSYGPDIASVTALAGGGWVVTWGSAVAGGDPGDVHGRVFGADGVARGDDFRLGTGAAGYQGGASVLALPDGGFMAIWLDVPDGSWEGSIRARRFAADGTPLTGALVLRDGAIGYGAGAALMADGRLLLAWTGTRPGTEGESLATVRTDIFDLDGTLSEAGTQIGIDSSRWVVGYPGQITLPVLEQTEAPDLVRLADGSFVVSFSNNVLQRLDANGTPVGVPTVAGTVDPYYGTATVDIAPLAGDRYDSHSGEWVPGDSFIAVNTGGRGILGEIVGMAGGNTAMWRLYRQVDFEADADGSDVSVVGLPDGGFALAWAERRSAAGAPLESDIFLRVFDGRGIPQGNAVLVNSITAGHQTNPHLALLGDGSLLVTWTGAEAGGTGTDVFSRRMLLSEIANTAPSVTPLATITVTEDGGSSAPGTVFATDADGDPLTFTLKPGGATKGTVAFDPVARTYVYTPKAHTSGEDSFSILVNDGRGGQAEQMVKVTITEVNRPPVITISVPDLAVPSGTTTNFVIPQGAVVDPDVGDTLTFSAKLASGAALPAWLAFDAATRSFTASPAITDLGTIEVVVRVTDQGGLFAEDVVAVTVTPTLFGTRGGDVMDGTKHLGATLVGRQGSDAYMVDDPLDRVVEEAEGGADTVTASVDVTLSEQVEVLVLAGSARRGTGNALDNRITSNGLDNRLEGVDGNDTLTGLGGADTLDGGAGIDVLFGGLGNDLYLVDDAADRADEGTGDGTDIVRSSAATFTIGLGIERLELVGGAVEGIGAGGANELLGNALGNVLRGLLGADTLDGGTGADTMEGGIGDDVYVVDNAGDLAAEAPESNGDDLAIFTAGGLVLGAGIERLSMTVAGTAAGNALANTITGNDTANRLRGAEGNDTLHGGGGRDTLEGGEGNDMLQGGASADSLAGGIGNDIYLVVDAEDAIRELDAEGVDIVWSSADFHALANFVEELLLVEGGRAATGSSGGNRMTGSTGANQLDGAGGDDSLDGAGGNDELLGGLGADTLRGAEGADTMDGGASGDLYYVTEAEDLAQELAGSGNDTVLASVSCTLGAGIEDLRLLGLVEAGTGQDLANTITGNEAANLLRGIGGADRLVGGEGADTLEGGTGRDTLEGGKDADYFLFRTVAEAEGDLILRYGKGVDKIAISATGFGGGLVVGMALAEGETFLTSRGNLATSEAGVGQLIYEQDAKALWWDADGAGGDDSVLIATFKPKPNLVPTDIVIVA
jgi:Ca2+-binding RTX toxin-like protein